MSEEDVFSTLVVIFDSEPIKEVDFKLTRHRHYKEIRHALEQKAMELSSLEIKSFLPFSKQFLEECTCIKGLVQPSGKGHRAEPKLPTSFVLELVDCFKFSNLSQAQRLDLSILLRGSPEIERVLEDRRRCSNLRIWPERYRLILNSVKAS